MMPNTNNFDGRMKASIRRQSALTGWSRKGTGILIYISALISEKDN